MTVAVLAACGSTDTPTAPASKAPRSDGVVKSRRPGPVHPVHRHWFADDHPGGRRRGHVGLLRVRRGPPRPGGSHLRVRPRQSREERSGACAARNEGVSDRPREPAEGGGCRRPLCAGRDVRRRLHQRGLRLRPLIRRGRSGARRGRGTLQGSAEGDRRGDPPRLAGQRREARLPPDGEGRLEGPQGDRRHPDDDPEQRVQRRGDRDGGVPRREEAHALQRRRAAWLAGPEPAGQAGGRAHRSRDRGAGSRAGDHDHPRRRQGCTEDRRLAGRLRVPAPRQGRS